MTETEEAGSIFQEPIAPAATPPPRRQQKGRRAPGRPTGTFRHGTDYAYRTKRCRCSICTTEYRRRAAAKGSGAPKTAGASAPRRSLAAELGLAWGLAGGVIGRADRPVGQLMRLQAVEGAGERLERLIAGTRLDAVLQRMLRAPSPRLLAAVELAGPLLLVSIIERRPEVYDAAPVQLVCASALGPLAERAGVSVTDLLRSLLQVPEAAGGEAPADG